MKKVFQNHSQVCHAFNLQNQYEGRAGNIFFYDTKIYSYGYHYLLGEFIQPNLILINNKGYSNSTSKHIGILTNATRDKDQMFTTHIEINLVLNELETLYKKLLKARKPRQYFYSLTRLITRFNRNLNWLGGFFVSNNFNSEFTLIALDKVCKDHKAKLDRINELEKLAKQYQESETYKRKIERAKELEAIKEEKEKEKREQRAKELERTKAERIQRFYDYKAPTIGNLDFDLLRLSKCGEYVETSQAVRIPIDEAKRYFKIFSSGAKLIGEKISHYTTISNDNYLQIGCHKIEHKEANRIGQLITE